MMWRIMIVLAVLVKMSEAGVPLPRKVVLNGDNLEILCLDIMSAEVRVSNNVKEMADRVKAALDRHGAKLDGMRADLQRSMIAAAAALDRQAARMDLVEAVLSELVNATIFQIDIRPLISGFESVIRNAGLEARAAASAAREAVAAANATRDDVKEAVAASPSMKSAPAPGWDEWKYWWDWWKSTWYTPLSLFFLGFALYEADRKAHVIGFFILGAFFQPYIAGVALVLVGVRKSTACGRKTRRWIQLTPCGRYLCPRAAAELRREEVLASMAMGRTPSRRARARSMVMNSTMYESALDETDPPPTGFWAYARSWLNPSSRYRPLGAHNSFIVWYV
jgi:hypothetical protein